jgi:zinc transport system substrate-binding protein
MNPANAAPWLEAIAATLADLDPGNADAYRANAAAGIARIAALEAEVAEILAPVGDAGLVMYHDAYGYLATAFGLNILGTIALGDATDPGAARISAIRASLREAGAACVFPEVNHADAYVALVSEVDDGLRVGRALDPEGVMLEPGADLFPTLMLEMATAIADCVAGS